jgi:predicted Fe-Mo cluster-binding NifX family protein
MTRKLTVSTIMFFALLCIKSPAIAENRTCIAVASEGSTADAQISPLAARCSHFLFFNAQGEFMEALVNPHRWERRGAGPQVVEFLSAKAIHTVIAGEFGAKMIAALKQKGMVFHTEAGTAVDAVRRIQRP